MDWLWLCTFVGVSRQLDTLKVLSATCDLTEAIMSVLSIQSK